ncbi:MAG: hypothetical protein HQL40_10425 [Alphaproteobacteria bacterium]|nr:hypothetical protein [Alphaproteobacteria bacterium]MBF0372702.1 hypothetical protein [Alphaproteobacteria bacterium]
MDGRRLLSRVAALETLLHGCCEELKRPRLTGRSWDEMANFCFDSKTAEGGESSTLLSLTNFPAEPCDPGVTFLGMTRQQWMNAPDELVSFFGPPLTEAVAHWRRQHRIYLDSIVVQQRRAQPRGKWRGSI